MGLKEFARNGLNAALDMAPLRGAAKFIATNDAIIFMLHRFEQPELGIDGHDPDFLRACLDYLRRRSFNLVSVEQIVTAARAGNRIKSAVSFTVDGGYLEPHLEGVSNQVRFGPGGERCNLVAAGPIGGWWGVDIGGRAHLPMVPRWHRSLGNSRHNRTIICLRRVMGYVRMDDRSRRHRLPDDRPATS